MGKIYYLMGKSASGKDHIYEASDPGDGAGFKTVCPVYNTADPERGAGRKRVFLCG